MRSSDDLHTEHEESSFHQSGAWMRVRGCICGAAAAHVKSSCLCAFAAIAHRSSMAWWRHEGRTGGQRVRAADLSATSVINAAS